jgi:N-acetylglucosaminyldiphosphoundecaprenol N-acetyl-beta-D-mannosaminyltransferase
MAMQSIPRANVLGVELSAVNMDASLEAILSAVESRARGYVCVTGVHGVMEAQEDLVFKKVLNDAFLNVPDGMPMSWVGWAQGFRSMDRVYGPDLMLEISRLSVEHGFGHFYYGGKEGVAEQLAICMSERFPGLRVSGAYCPPFRDLTREEADQLILKVNQIKPHFFWVGLSTPKQERFMAEYIHKLDTNIMLGVGAAFDFHTGRVRQAPRWMMRSGLEWLFRLTQEPTRLWRRYLVNNPRFIWLITQQFLKIRNFEVAGR